MERLTSLPTKESPDRIESVELQRLREQLQLSIEVLAIPGDWKNQIDNNPYRFGANSELIYSQWDETPQMIKDFHIIQREYAAFLNKNSQDGQSHMNDACFLSSLGVLKELHRMQEYLDQTIKALEESITKAPIMAERGCDENETKENWNEMNKKSAELPEDCWSPEKLQSMPIAEYVAHVRKYSSGRSFCHTFPGISFEKGEIVTGIGGASRSEEGFQNIRDGADGIQINFTPESIDPATNTYRHRHYIGLGNLGGEVYYPAEVLMDNYAMLNLPYNQKNNWVSSEWRNVAPGSPNSELHAIPLSLGIVFFPKSFEEQYNEMTTKNAALILPRVVFYDEGETTGMDPTGLNHLLEEGGVNKKSIGLPKTANIIRPIATIGERNETIAVFGTQKAKAQWG